MLPRNSTGIHSAQPFASLKRLLLLKVLLVPEITAQRPPDETKRGRVMLFDGGRRAQSVEN